MAGTAIAPTTGREPSRPVVVPAAEFQPVIIDQMVPEPTYIRPVVAVPSPIGGSVRVESRATGVASWYRWHPGEAAAGPPLRVGDWRGRVVTVSANGVTITVRLTDWCACPERAIDLDHRSFAQLAPLSRGLVKVDISW